MELANTIINIAKDMDLDPYDDNELVKALRDEEANPPLQIANLLGFRSNLKYQLSQYDGQPDKQRHVLLRFFAETNLQKAIPSFVLTGVDVDDYINLLKAFQAIYDAHESDEVDIDGFKQNLISAENTLDQILDRMFGGTCQSVRIMHGESSPYPHLLEMLKRMKSGDRMQIVYTESFNYKNINEHLIGLDVENIEGNYNIFCFSNMDETRLKSFVNKLASDVKDSRIKACSAPIPTGRNSDKLIAIAVLKKMTKYAHVFSYIPDENETMVPLSSLPTNIIAMNQSYQTIKAFLEEAKQKGLFDLDIDEFIALHKIKYLLDENEYKEVYRTFENVDSYAGVAQEESVDGKYEIIRDLKHGKQVDVKRYMDGLRGDHERVAYLLALASSIFNHNKVNTPIEFENRTSSFTPEEISFLKQLRAECMALINHDLTVENDILHAGNKLLFQVNLD
jgi:hypothetical protein